MFLHGNKGERLIGESKFRSERKREKSEQDRKSARKMLIKNKTGGIDQRKLWSNRSLCGQLGIRVREIAFGNAVDQRNLRSTEVT